MSVCFPPILKYKDRKTGGTTKYGGAQPEQYKKKKTGFPYMDPDEVEGYYKVNNN